MLTKERTAARAEAYSAADEYEAVQAVRASIPAGGECPGCFAFGLDAGELTERGGLLFTREGDAVWLALQHVARGHHRWGDGKPFDRLTAYTTAHRFGVPHVGPDSYAWHEDLRDAPPFDGDERMVRLVNALSWAAISTGYATRNKWKPHRHKLLEFARSAFGLPMNAKYLAWREAYVDRHQSAPTRDEELDHTLFFGGWEARGPEALRDRSWAPLPMLAFPAHLTDRLHAGQTEFASPMCLAEAMMEEVRDGMLPVTVPFSGRLVGIDPGRAGRTPTLTLHFRLEDGRRRRLEAAADIVWAKSDAGGVVEVGSRVAAGDQIGAEPVPGWRAGRSGGLSPKVAAGRCSQADPHRFSFLVRAFLGRNTYEIDPGFVHVPAALGVVAAAEGRSVPEMTRFMVTPAAADYFDESCGAFVFPALEQQWAGTFRRTVGTAMGWLEIDATPPDDRFMRVPCWWFDAPKLPEPKPDAWWLL